MGRKRKAGRADDDAQRIEDLARDAVWVPQSLPQALFVSCPADDAFYGGSRGSGKMQPLDSRVLTPKGWVRMADLRVGDVVSEPVTGGACQVVGVYPQRRPQRVFRLRFDDGTSCVAGEEHLWAFKLPNHQRPRTKPSSEREFFREALGSSNTYAEPRCPS